LSGAGAVPIALTGDKATCNPNAGDHANLAGCNLSGRDLAGLNLTYANLTNAIVTKVNLVRGQAWTGGFR